MLGPVKRDTRLSVRLPGEILGRLRIVAELEGRSMALQAIEAALVRAEARLARRRNKPDGQVEQRVGPTSHRATASDRQQPTLAAIFGVSNDGRYGSGRSKLRS